MARQKKPFPISQRLMVTIMVGVSLTIGISFLLRIISNGYR